MRQFSSNLFFGVALACSLTLVSTLVEFQSLQPVKRVTYLAGCQLNHNYRSHFDNGTAPPAFCSEATIAVVIAPQTKKAKPPPPPPPAPPRPFPDTPLDYEEVSRIAKKMPLFPGCDNMPEAEKKACADKKLLEFVYRNFKYPTECGQNCCYGMVVISFVIEKDGELAEAKILRDPGCGFGKEVLRVVNLIPQRGLRWSPARSGGRACRLLYTLPIRFEFR